ncbi:MAG: glycosyl hydrolase [Saprospiraceae bacterium]|nr:glycosyl hydrolase [Saprospiraceae bacterium]
MRQVLLSALLILVSIFAIFAQGSVEVSNSKSELTDFFKPLKYRSIGPFRGGRSVCASGVIGDPLTYYMGTTGGGVWKTGDAGHHWKNISDGYFGMGSVGAIAVSTSDPNVVYVGMGEHAPRGVMTSFGDGVYKSTDAGKTWKHIGLKETQHISRIIIHPKNPDILYVAAQGQLHGNNVERGIFKSTDGGLTWRKVLYVNDRTGCAELSMDASDPNILYAAMWEHQRLPWKVISGGPGSGLYKSMDGGATWKEMKEGLPEEKGKMAVAVCQSNPQKVYALIESDSEQEKGGLFVSENAGKSWSRASADHRLIQRAWYYIELFTDPKDENTLYVLSAPALRSIDGGKSWEVLGGTHGDYHDLWINPNNAKNLCIANDGGAAISFNYGESWSTQSNMPTGQFYRINVDNQFPYRIYAGQQDNTSVSIAHMELGAYGISNKSWDASAGGESAFLAFDPNDPRYVLGGSYLGTIEVLDTKAAAGTNIMAAPIQYLARDASDMKYRFNWNAPIIWSQHEPNTFYHGAQMLLRTRDFGKTWEEASPDLTRNEKEKQGKGGGPYTNEAVGAENYGTIAYVIESPHEKGVIWVGTDDGYVQLTRDGGKTWVNVTPKTLKECLVNALEVSPHNPGTAYIATTRYKFNDHTPKLMKTTDYGKTWTDITGNIPYGAFTRVVREDSKRKDLLFAGTETGLYLSWNGGKNWEKFNLNLPVTPILDLMIKHDDLIVATSGRAFWILDDLELLRQYQTAKDQTILYAPENAFLSNHGSELDDTSEDFDGTNSLRGVNPASGVVIYYFLPEAMDSIDLELSITDKNGNLVQHLSSKEDKAHQSYPSGPSAAPTIPKKKGLNRFVWNMRYPSMIGAPTAYIEGSYEGHKVAPGEYALQLKIGKQALKTTCTILPNPLYGLSAEDYDAYDQFMATAEREFNAMHQMVNDLMKLQKQLSGIIVDLDTTKYATLKKEAQELVAKMKSWDEDMVQRKSKAYDDVENFPNKFTANYLFAINHAESAIPRVNQPTRDRIAELNAEWSKLKQRGEIILNTEIPAFNKKLWEAGIGALWIGK